MSVPSSELGLHHAPPHPLANEFPTPPPPGTKVRGDGTHSPTVRRWGSQFGRPKEKAYSIKSTLWVALYKETLTIYFRQTVQCSHHRRKTLSSFLTDAISVVFTCWQGPEINPFRRPPHSEERRRPPWKRRRGPPSTGQPLNGSKHEIVRLSFHTGRTVF